MNPASITSRISAGGVIYRKNPEGFFEVALVSVKGGSVWTLPKGLVGKNESLEQTALREAGEETGLRGELVKKIGEISYWYYVPKENVKCKKTVHFYLIRFLSGSTSGHDSEVDEAAWFPVDEALEKTHYKGDKQMLAGAKKLIEELGLNG